MFNETIISAATIFSGTLQYILEPASKIDLHKNARPDALFLAASDRVSSFLEAVNMEMDRLIDQYWQQIKILGSASRYGLEAIDMTYRFFSI